MNGFKDAGIVELEAVGGLFTYVPPIAWVVGGAGAHLSLDVLEH